MKGSMSAEELERLRANLISIQKETVIDRDFSGVKIQQFESYMSTFVGCRFDSMKIDCAVFASGKKRSVYRDCSFDGIRIKRVLGGLARFERCSFRNVVITGWSLEACDLVDCVFTGKMKSGCYGGSFWGAPTPYRQKEYQKRVNEFRGNDFSECSLVDMDFRRGVDLRLQILPQGPDYLYVEDGRRAVERALKKLECWEDEALRQKGRICLEVLHDKIIGDQKQLFISNASGRLTPIWSQLCEALVK